MLPTCDPSPTCMAFMPPTPSEGRVAGLIIWANPSLKVTLRALKAMVLTFETLWPMTSILVCWFRRPETAEESARGMVCTPRVRREGDAPVWDGGKPATFFRDY